ncbi:MAG: malto-oligosyltrehalose synthase, partial [Acidobacteria bacterium]|nr:malto-oligosyltrehalose synthase [Acidobacteriota bacterium]
AVAGYLADLGITDLYASPILRARKGSGHGYDVVDAAMLNPELGTEEDFQALHERLEQHGLGLVLDVVPNHMAASPENAWWMSVLENGPQSRFFHFFDFDWSPVPAQGKVEHKIVLPILGKPYGEAVESREIQLAYDEGGLHFRYYDRRLPLSPESYAGVLRECIEALPEEGVAIELRELVSPTGAVDVEPIAPNSRFLKETLWRIYEGQPSFREALDAAILRINGEEGSAESFNALDALLDAQHYRLAYWRIASEKINYRRFFDVTDLVGVRIENPEVFEARHRRTIELVASGQITGLRIDHIDGLYDPIGHLRKLQLRLAEPRQADAAGEGQEEPPARAASGEPLYCYILVEKILAAGEDLPREFAVSGTTGYDFIDTLNGVSIDPQGLERLTAFYRSFTGLTDTFADIAYERKKQVIGELFSGEMRALGDRLAAVAAMDRNARDFAPSELLAALTEITACMNVYRTYIRGFEVSEADRGHILAAAACARERSGIAIDDRIYAFLERVLLVEPPPYVETDRERWLSFVMRWQQFTGRVMAKGVEDTSFYNYNRLVSLNEVGGEPGRRWEDGLGELHARNERIARDWPQTMNASSTHDTKRSEDVRARINVLSELADTWEREARRWSKLNEPLRVGGVPDPNVELMLYQNLLGMWPLDESEQGSVPERLRQYLEKASREAKTDTSWIAPAADYEQALFTFAERILSHEPFLASFRRLQKRVAFHGFLGSLAQVVLKITSPGVPDFYQGSELWDFSLVDPDNRRPVDYHQRQALLRKLRTADARGALDVSALLRRWTDGRVKLFTTWRALEARNRHTETFRGGSYRPLDGGEHVCAFLRGEAIVVAVPRLTTKLVKPGVMPLGEVWGDAALPVAGRWRNAFTGELLEGAELPLSGVFSAFPVAILERQ